MLFSEVMMKKILTVFTGGTICCAPEAGQRNLNPLAAKRALFSQFFAAHPDWSPEQFEESGFPEERQTLSENLTIEKINDFLSHIRGFDLSQYQGLIVLHGTDTLAFTAAALAVCLADSPVPICLVSANHPPMEEGSNALSNFAAAAKLIAQGLAPNVYVPYRNADGKLYLHLGANLLQCESCTDDFRSAKPANIRTLSLKEADWAFYECLSKARVPSGTTLSGEVLLLYPYPGLRYDVLSLQNVRAVVHSTYHSGTICTGLGAAPANSAQAFASRCQEAGVPLYLAPAQAGPAQYSSLFTLLKNTDARCLSMSTELAYAKAMAGLAQGFRGEDLSQYMQTPCCNEV